MEKFIIYGLIDPTTEEVRYIGKSSSGLVRARAHLKPSQLNSNSNRHKNNWLSAAKKSGKIEILIFEQLDLEVQLNEAEKKWIAYARSVGWRLTNIKEGGIGGPLSIETRQRISERLKGHPVSEKTRKAVSDSNRGRQSYVRTEEHRERSRQRNLGKTLSSEARRKISETKRIRQKNSFPVS